MDKEKLQKISISLILIAIACLSIFDLYLLVKTVPRYKYFYDTLGAMLPFVTLIVIAMSDFIRNWFIFLLPLFLVVFFVCILGAVKISNKVIITTVFSFMLLILALFTYTLNFALTLPMKKIAKIMKFGSTKLETEFIQTIKKIIESDDSLDAMDRNIQNLLNSSFDHRVR